MDMASINTSETSWIYQDGPSREDVQTQYLYRKTRRYYEFQMERGSTLQLQDLEGVPAPVACPSCQKPVITTLKTERTFGNWYSITFAAIVGAGMVLIITSPMHAWPGKTLTVFKGLLIGFATILSAGIMAYLSASVGGTLIHGCPSCKSRLVITTNLGEPRVLRSYDSEDGKPAKSLYTEIHMNGSVYYQWNNTNSRIGNQAEGISIQTQSNRYTDDPV